MAFSLVVDERIPGALTPELRRLLHRAAAFALSAEGAPPDVEIGLSLVDDDHIRDLNARFRDVDAPTDVLAFPGLAPEEWNRVLDDPDGFPERPLLLGDVVVSVPAARRQGDAYGHGFQRELAFLFVHGLLHLLGYDHKDEESRRRMRAAEEAALQAAGAHRDAFPGGAQGQRGRDTMAPTTLEPQTIDRLLEAARRVRKRAYAPYSRFQVGAALLTAGGRVVTGCNVENAAFGPTLCAERNAVAQAVALGQREFRAVAVVADYDEPVPPCGTCRQVLAEFAPDMPVIMANLQGERRVATVRELLPGGFSFHGVRPAAEPGEARGEAGSSA